MREPRFHVFERFTPRWPDVEPGDVVISPDARTYLFNEFIDRDEASHPVIVKHNPLLVLARLDVVVGERLLAGECGHESPDDLSTFIVLSITRGFLITIKSRRRHGNVGT